MRLSVTPKTSWGKWSVSLAAAFVLLFALFLALAASGQRGPGFNPVLAVAIIPAGISGIAAFVTGVIGIAKSRERSLLVFLSTLTGWWVLIFVLGGFLSPG